ncbi:sensor histidine kinase [Actinocorallia populi]|uniref:sensor histidine kinase n=1 Tax=Actinocorallia populi TaxID=2079200 RepID=UPI000D09414E|nr:sensor histidine kinase [Actinocorallia populi]
MPASRPARVAASLIECAVTGLHATAAGYAGMVVTLTLLLLPLGVGFPLLTPAARFLRARSDAARSRAARRSGIPLAAPDPLPVPAEEGAGARDRARLILTDRGFWRDLEWAWLEPWAGGLPASLPPALVGYGATGVLLQPIFWWFLDKDSYAYFPVHSTAMMGVTVALGLALTAAGAFTASPALSLHDRWSRVLLAVPRNTRLERRVVRLSDTRAQALDAQAAELRRIERDLHDGAQARLVALGMTLDRATRLLDSDPDRARELLADVGRTSQQALVDLRDLVHGIHPPVLADRGLGDAVRSLALDSFLDVHVEVGLRGRLPSPVEAAAYFGVSEALANAAKHSGAREVRITLDHEADVLRVAVTDDGRGGADPALGTGLAGVGRRLEVFDGTLTVTSPPGGPTNVVLEVPCASS